MLVRIALVRSTFRIAALLPLRGYVVLATAHVPHLRGNLAAIRDGLQARHPGTRIVTLIQAPTPGRIGRLRAVLDALVAGWHLARARVFVVDSHYLPMYVIRPRAGTTFVQVWHACGAIKRIGYSVLDKTFGASERLVATVRIHSNYTFCLAASEAAAVQYVDAFRQPRSLFVTDLGIPRTDVLVDRQRWPDLIASIRRRYGIPDDRKVILWAPTFRGTSMLRAQSPELLDLDALEATLGQDHVLLARLHPAVRMPMATTPELARFVKDVSDYPEVNELMLVADVLVTDYSSVAFEFALLRRPMAFFAPDIGDYDQERGFYFDYRTGVPGPVFETTAELAAWLQAGAFDADRVDAFARTWFEVADGHATERFVEQVVMPALAGLPAPSGVPGS
jgi:CDP-glycerol glycerophosphotransferase (TagB/SpsB family)